MSDFYYLQNFKHCIQEEYTAVQFKHCRRMVYFQSDIVQVETPNVNGWNIIADSEPCSVSCQDSYNVQFLKVLYCTSHQFKREEVDIPEWNEEIAQSKEYYPPRYIFTLIPADEATSCKFQLKLTGTTDEDLKFSFDLHCPKKQSTPKQKGKHFSKF